MICELHDYESITDQYDYCPECEVECFEPIDARDLHAAFAPESVLMEGRIIGGFIIDRNTEEHDA